jgi:Domain of unknown function (DUF4194)
VRSAEERAIAVAIIDLMRGVVYRESQEDSWAALDRHGAAVRDHFATVGVGVVVDDTEGYAYLQTQEQDDDEEQLPRLVRRRSLTYNVSLLLVLLRKRLVEFETVGGEGKLVLSRDQIMEMLRVFLGQSTNEARVLDRIDTTVKQVTELGFLRPMRRQPSHWEVRRVLKAYVDAQVLSDFAGKLRDYAEATQAGATDD